MGRERRLSNNGMQIICIVRCICKDVRFIVSWKPYRSKAQVGKYMLKNTQGVVYRDRTLEVQ